jgi:hypothetical protein
VSAAGADPRQRLGDLRRGLLRLHKALVDAEREAYERAHGPVASSGRLLQLLIHDPWFAWLRPFSELIVRIDVALDAEEPPAAADARALAAEARSLLALAGGETHFATAYRAAMQREAAVVLAHAELRRLVGSDDA